MKTPVSSLFLKKRYEHFVAETDPDVFGLHGLFVRARSEVQKTHFLRGLESVHFGLPKSQPNPIGTHWVQKQRWRWSRRDRWKPPIFPHMHPIWWARIAFGPYILLVAFLFLVVMPGAPSSFLLLVAMPFVPSSFLFLVAHRNEGPACCQRVLFGVSHCHSTRLSLCSLVPLGLSGCFRMVPERQLCNPTAH